MISSMCLGQVGIGTENVHLSEALKVEASNKGVLLPKISIPDLQQAPPVANPATSLMVYNTNVDSGKGHYYWFNNQWNPLLNSENIYKLLGIAKLTIKKSSSTMVANTETGTISYTENETPSSRWTLIPGLSHTVNVTSTKNNIVVNIDGIAQRNNLSSSNTGDFMSYAIGLFINDQLKAVRNFVVTGNNACLYGNFGLSFNQQNLGLGSYKIEVRQTLRAKAVSSAFYDKAFYNLTFGGKSTSCTNLADDMARTELAIQLTENK
ncbi:hypothetical protein [Riemerella anatipestifer]|uniref:hypothetical protein n=1 Tax=Riemerella anatipestifer TaxID=34085 RepID=UPI000FDD5885|nr:hypothetical protein [Riemerella anatipestifer]MBT0549104.1 hypothetical protein [Riemerella anatipestifer]MBT0556101.1 hypothetical protein [Riemerella anatipestifer]MBT0572850.1 hypothetical protein [Riemerella anatipestifer]NAV16353.1 hypothetical protein [Riemerella anatipestifer]QZO88355.1 hypothetical protein K6T42_04920 [Riemerella anatipestifer]